MKTVVAWINDVAVGELREEAGELSFLYYSSWIHRPDAFPLGDGLPLQSGAILDIGPLEGVKRYVGACLPGKGERLMRMAMHGHVAEQDRQGLLACYGDEGIGAVSWQEPGQPERLGGSREISREEAGRMLAEGRVLSGGLLPGSMAKMGVIYKEDGSGYVERKPGVASTCVLKGAGPGSTKDKSRLVSEWLIQTLANKVGLQAVAPDLHYWGGGEGVILESLRYDRFTDPLGRIIKLCVATGSQLVNHPPGHPLSPEVLREIEARTLIPLMSRQELFRWMLFNTLVGNTSVHINKLAAVRWTNGWMVAPFAGMRSLPAPMGEGKAAAPEWERIRMPFLLGEAKSYGELSLDWLAGFGEAIGISRRMAGTMAEEMIETLGAEAATLLRSLTKLHGEDMEYAYWVLGVVIPGLEDQAS